MLKSTRYMEDESVSCTPSSILIRSPQTCDSSFTQPVFTPLEITRDSSNDASTSRRRDSSDSEEDHKRVRMTLGSSSPDPTPVLDDPPSTSAPTNPPESPLGRRQERIPTQSISIRILNTDRITPTTSSITQADSDTAHPMSKAMVDARKSGEVSSASHTTASLIEEVGRMSPFGTYPW